MVIKNKRLKKKEKYAQGKLAEAQRRISMLKEELCTQPVAKQQRAASIMQEELRNMETALAKTQKAAVSQKWAGSGTNYGNPQIWKQA